MALPDDALDDHVVVARRLVVGANEGAVLGDAVLDGDVLEHQLGERVVGAGLLTGGRYLERGIGVVAAATDLLAELVGFGPVLEAIGLRPEEGVEVLEAEALDLIVLRTR